MCSKKILFVCGSMEPSKDGVGDYTRRLAVQFKKKNHTTAVLAIDDRYINKPILETQFSDNSSIEVFRIPFQYPIIDALQWILNFGAEIYSLQYVPYSFSDKGIHRGLGKKLQKIATIGPWHIMFHELWIGMESRRSLKDLAIGWFQRQMVKRLINALNPFLITTQIDLYSSKLRSMGFEVSKLSLFSNIPQTFEESSSSLLSKKGIKQQHQFTIFGSIHPENNFEKFAKSAGDFQRENNKKFRLTIIGHKNDEQEHWREIWKENGMDAEILGALSPEGISEVLNHSSIGLSTTSMSKIEKSGSVLAMLEHGLNVICLSKHKLLPETNHQQNLAILNFNDLTFQECMNKNLQRKRSFSGLEMVTEKFEILLDQHL